MRYHVECSEIEGEPIDDSPQVERKAKANLHSLFDEIERKQRREREGKEGGNITWQNRAWMEWGRERESGVELEDVGIEPD